MQTKNVKVLRSYSKHLHLYTNILVGKCIKNRTYFQQRQKPTIIQNYLHKLSKFTLEKKKSTTRPENCPQLTCITEPTHFVFKNTQILK